MYGCYICWPKLYLVLIYLYIDIYIYVCIYHSWSKCWVIFKLLFCVTQVLVMEKCHVMLVLLMSKCGHLGSSKLGNYTVNHGKRGMKVNYKDLRFKWSYNI